MKKIAVMNQKGGTGKTTTAINIAAGLARSGFKTLIIDADPQGNVSAWFGIRSEKTLYNLLLEEIPYESCVVKNVRENLDVILSDNSLAAAEQILVAQPLREKALKRKLSALKGYDYVFIDCGPSLSIMNINSLTYADSIIIPISMEYLSLVGVKLILESISMVQNVLEHAVEIAFVVPTFFDARTNKSREVLQTLEKHFPGKVSNTVRTNVRLSECPSFHKTIYEYSPKSTGAEDYMKLVKKIAAVK